MPLWIVLTKWPAPSVPSQAAQGSPSYLAEIAVSTFSTRFHDASVPPTMIDGPCRAPSSPPETPMPMKVRPEPSSSSKRRIVSRKLALPASIMMSLADSTPRRCAICSSTALAGLHHDDDRPRRTDGGGQLLDRVAGHDHVLQRAGLVVEFRVFAVGAVEHRDPVALFGDVEREVRAHHAKADQSDFGVRHRSIP